jgi:tRNA pseudouridine32 synthase/23S rRNA pseudouridine746 synthase/23S rRNA pseudouridine955/2504/2580 synthase
VTGFRVLARAPGFIAIDKPPGAVVIPARNAGGELSVREALEEKLGQKVFVVHRIDRDTSGVLLFALDGVTHRALSIAFQTGEVEKQYLALVRGSVDEPVELSFPLVSARRGRMRKARPGEKGKPAVTRVRPVETFKLATLVEAQPLTGRTHQIRVHLLEAGHPLLVDSRYGQPAALLGSEVGDPAAGVLLERTPLHAWRLIIPPALQIEPRAIESPMPSDMARALEALRSSSRSDAKGIG